MQGCVHVYVGVKPHHITCMALLPGSGYNGVGGGKHAQHRMHSNLNSSGTRPRAFINCRLGRDKIGALSCSCIMTLSAVAGYVNLERSLWADSKLLPGGSQWLRQMTPCYERSTVTFSEVQQAQQAGLLCTCGR